jgi:hypothetical protein
MVIFVIDASLLFSIMNRDLDVKVLKLVARGEFVIGYSFRKLSQTKMTNVQSGENLFSSRHPK